MNLDNNQECSSRNIPLPIQREVRQRCGFGCVICGMPLYEYEHMEEWAEVKRHVAEEITLLCDQHHREKTGGLLPKEVVKEADKNPYNLRKGVSKPYNLHFAGKEAKVEIGGNSFTCQDRGYGTAMVPISVDGTPLIGLVLADGHLLLNVVIFDEFNAPVLHIKNNQLYYSTSPWDIQLVGTKLTLREAHRKILLEIDFYPPNRVVIERGRFLRNGVEILVRPSNLLVTNNSTLLSGNHAHNCYGGLIIGYHEKPIGGFMAIAGVPRYLGDRKEALKFERESLSRIEQASPK
ncbi:cell division protein [Pseudoalteromonas sp. S4488]|nr:cell division protein [Pseudoalteromonas sp. S4488]RZF78871.1 cell division protein [Pseudoalteromonas sp. CO109Y]TMO32868.1 cell division protein [Pseudoalteromonas sp. S4491]TMO37601.1 cell division protein [Pseudoalteromonas sp. S4488]